MAPARTSKLFHAGLEPHVDMDPPVARGLGVADDAELVEQGADVTGGLPDLVESDTGLGVEVDAELVGVVRIIGPVRPQV